MSVLMWILVGVGVLALLAVLAFFVFVIIDMEKEIRVERRHAKAVLEGSGDALTGAFAESYPYPKIFLADRSTIPYADEAAFGTDDDYLLTLAAPFNARRCTSNRIVGGFFDRVKLIDPDLGPVNEADKEMLRLSLVNGGGIKNFEQLGDVLEFGLLDLMNYETSQVLSRAGITVVPQDLKESTNAETLVTYQDGIDRLKTVSETLDLRTYRLVMLIHYARIGATLEWIPEREAWGYIRRIGDELRARVCRYHSWDAYGEMILRCHTYLTADGYISKRLNRQLKFLNSEACSPWKKLAIHHGAAQKSFAEVVPKLRLNMPQPHVSKVAFPELAEGRYLEAGARLIATPNCMEIAGLVRGDTTLEVPQATLDDLVKANPDHAGIHLLAGYHALEAGFEARGTKTANWVSEEAFAVLQERTRRACDLAIRGFELAPDHHGFVDLVIAAADHTAAGDVYGELTQKAFDLAGSQHLDDLALQMQLMRPLLEKWGGRTGASFSMAEDRVARSSNPLAGVLLVYAAIEYVALNSSCGGSDNRHKDLGIRDLVHKVAADLLVLTGDEDARRVRMWLTYWAYAAGDLEMLIKIGPFEGAFPLGNLPWIYLSETKARVVLAAFSDIAGTVGHRDWLRLTDFYEDQAVPDGPVQ